MPVDFAQLLRNAYRVTMNHPRLWFFGLFLVGGFNLGFLNFQKFDWPVRELGPELVLRLPEWQAKPETLLVASALVLGFGIVAFVLTNLAKVLLILDMHAVLPGLQFQFGTKDVKQQRPSFRALLKTSRRYLLSVIWASFLTTFLLAGVSVVVIAPIFLLFQSSPAEGFMLALGALLVLGLTFVISCLNIFAIFFIILGDQSVRAALNLATDFLLHKWKEILALAVMLVFAYSLCFFAGVSVIFSVHFLVEVLAGFVKGFGVLGGSAIIIMSRLISGVVIWLLLAVLNVFFNASLLLLFAQLVKPLQGTQFAQGANPLPVSAPH